MKKLFTCITAGLLVLGAQSLMAEDSTNSTPSSPTTGEHQKATPEQRKERMAALLKMLDLTPADVKGLSREDRQTKMKDAAEKVVADLQAKQTAGTLTAEGQTRLEKVQKYLAHANHKAAAAPSTTQ